MTIHNIFYAVLTACLIVVVACNGETNEQKIAKTTEKVIEIIENGKAEDFERLFVMSITELVQKKEMIDSDFEMVKAYARKYLWKQDLKFMLTDEYTMGGSRKVHILLNNSSKIIEGKKKFILELQFGPEEFVPFDRLAGYQLLYEPDVPREARIPELIKKN